MNCGNCGAAKPDGARFCGRCGSQLTYAGPDQLAPVQVTSQDDPPAAPAYPPLSRRWLAPVAATVAIVVLAVLAVTGWREHWPAAVFGHPGRLALTWSAAEAPLPADAAGRGSQSASLDDLTCSDVRDCISVGYYYSPDHSGASYGSTQGLIDTYGHGIWTPAAAPTDMASVQFAMLNGIACPAKGTCVAVGNEDSQNDQRSLIETLSNGTWTPAAVSLPAGAKSTWLTQVACPAPGRCVATGWFTAQNGGTQPLIETLANGSWTPSAAPLPAGAAVSKSSQSLPPALEAVRCPAVGSCVATGEYYGQGGSTQGLIETLADGSWTAREAPLPADAAASPNAYLWGIACPAPGTCIASGHYTSRNGQSQGLIDTLSDGRWTPVTAPLPADAAASQKWTENYPTGLDVAACLTASACVAAGSYTARDGTIQGELDTFSNGTWTAVRASLPADAAGAKQDAFFNAVQCPAGGQCVAVGGYKAQQGGTEGLIETARPAGST